MPTTPQTQRTACKKLQHLLFKLFGNRLSKGFQFKSLRRKRLGTHDCPAFTMSLGKGRVTNAAMQTNEDTSSVF
jgi:hypothetical protein